MRQRAIIFDLDGTLVDSAEDILQALKKAIRAASWPVPPQMSSRWIGPPVTEILERNLPEIPLSDRLRIVADFRKEYDNSPMSLTLPYAGACELIGRLRERGIRLFIATNKPQGPTKILIERHFSGSIDDFCCIDSATGTKLDKAAMVRLLLERHNLSPAATAVVGDGVSDIEAALQNGCRGLGVSFGYSTSEALAAAGAEEIFGSPLAIASFKEFQ